MIPIEELEQALKDHPDEFGHYPGEGYVVSLEEVEDIIENSYCDCCGEPSWSYAEDDPHWGGGGSYEPHYCMFQHAMEKDD
jgi:hypothetical protein